MLHRASRGRQVRSVKRASLAIPPRRPAVPFSTIAETTNCMAITISDLVAAVEPGEVKLDDTMSTYSTPYYRVCLDDNYKKSKHEQVRNVALFI